MGGIGHGALIDFLSAYQYNYSDYGFGLREAPPCAGLRSLRSMSTVAFASRSSRFRRQPERRWQGGSSQLELSPNAFGECLSSRFNVVSQRHPQLTDTVSWRWQKRPEARAPTASGSLAPSIRLGRVAALCKRAPHAPRTHRRLVPGHLVGVRPRPSQRDGLAPMARTHSDWAFISRSLAPGEIAR